jgi:hypothetical protein
MAISRMQEPRQLQNNGGIMQAVPRQGYFLGKLVKGVKKGVKGLAKGAKNLIKSDAGKLGLLALGGMIPFGASNTSLFGRIGQMGLPSFLSTAVDGYKALEGPQKFLAQAGIATAVSGGLAALMSEDQEEQEAITRDVGSLRRYLASYYDNLGYSADQIAENVDRDTSEYGYADGGRIGYAMGTGDKVEMAAGIEGLPININPKGVKELDLRETGGFIAPVGVKEKADDIPAMLSNNEFVFTADAVRAAGGGSVDKGAQIMYDTMKKLESKVV